MKSLLASALLLVVMALSACSPPLAMAGIIGSAITRWMYDEENPSATGTTARPAPDARQIAIANVNLGEEAETHFRHTIRLSSKNSNALNNYAQFLCSRGRQDEVVRYFLTAAENPLYITPEITYANIGTCAFQHGQVDKATTNFDKALAASRTCLPYSYR